MSTAVCCHEGFCQSPVPPVPLAMSMKKRPAAQMAVALEPRDFRVARSSSRWDVSAMPGHALTVDDSDDDQVGHAGPDISGSASGSILDRLKQRQLARARGSEAGRLL